MTALRPRRHMELLRFIQGYQLAHHGISPSFQECADALRTSKSRISNLFDDLECRGHARRLSSRARAMQVLRPVTVPMIGDQPLYAVRGPWSIRPRSAGISAMCPAARAPAPAGSAFATLATSPCPATSAPR